MVPFKKIIKNALLACGMLNLKREIEDVISERKLKKSLAKIITNTKGNHTISKNNTSYMTHFTFNKIVFIFICLVGFSACGKKQNENTIPSGIMSEETFTRVITDFALAESAANMNIKNSNLQKLDSVYCFNPLTDNGVTQVQYDSALLFYAKHPALYKKIYENVLAALNEIQTKRNPTVKDTTLK